MKSSVVADLSPNTESLESKNLRAKAIIYSFIANFLTTAIPVPGSSYVVSILEALKKLREEATETGYSSTAIQALEVARKQVDFSASQEQLFLAIDRTKYVQGLQTDNPVKPPFESLYLTSNDSLDEIANIAGYYRKAGLELLPNSNNRPDSLATECLFVAQLYEKQLEALQVNNHSQAQEISEIRRSFLTNHIGTWAPDYCDTAANHARSSVFKGVLLFAKEFIEEERKV